MASEGKKENEGKSDAVVRWAIKQEWLFVLKSKKGFDGKKPSLVCIGNIIAESAF